MKQKILLLFIAFLTISLTSCSDNDDSDNYIVPKQIEISFTKRYPSAQHVKWINKGQFVVAQFQQNNTHRLAWFNKEGIWHMTKEDISYQQLPQAVRSSFEKSEYATWKIDDVEKLERKNYEEIFIIEVEQGNKDVDLYYTTEGILIKTIFDDNDDDGSKLPEEFPAEIQSFINKKYPQARLIELEREHNRIEVDIIHNRISKDVIFDLNYKWILTSHEVHISELPKAVANVVNKPEYIGFYIDDADYVETANTTFYALELEKGNKEIKLKVDQQGNIIK